MKKMHILIVAAVIVALLGLAASAMVLNQPSDAQTTASSDTSNWTKVAISHQTTKNVANVGKNTTAGEGIALFWTNSNTTQMSYILFVSNATNLTMSHIHEKGPNNTPGAIVAWLYPSTAPASGSPPAIKGVSNGLMVTGTLTAANLTGPLANKSITDLVAQMNANNTLTAWHSTEYPAVYMWGNNTVNLSSPINSTQLRELAPLLSGGAASAPSAGAAAANATGAASKVTIDLTAQNIKFDKTTITVPAGANVTMNFHNKDQGVQHNFALYDSSAMKTTLFRGQIITGVSDTTYTFTAPTTPGTYYFQCDVHGSAMSGSFVVQ